MVRRCLVSNSAFGIGAGQGSVVADNTLLNMESRGIFAGWGGLTIVGNTLHQSQPTGACIVAPQPGNRIEGNTCTGWWGGLILTGGSSFFAKNLLSGNVVPVEGGELPNIDGATIDPALSNVIMP
jgi:hypothetical protein